MSEHHEDKDDRVKSGRGKHGRDKNEGEGVEGLATATR